MSLFAFVVLLVFWATVGAAIGAITWGGNFCIAGLSQIYPTNVREKYRRGGGLIFVLVYMWIGVYVGSVASAFFFSVRDNGYNNNSPFVTV